jgi:hypothetical protein
MLRFFSALNSGLWSVYFQLLLLVGRSYVLVSAVQQAALRNDRKNAELRTIVPALEKYIRADNCPTYSVFCSAHPAPHNRNHFERTTPHMVKCGWYKAAMQVPKGQKNLPGEDERRPAWEIDYVAFLREAVNIRGQDVVAVLAEELPYAWREAYLLMMPRATNIVRFRYGTFEYIYDDYATLEATGAVPQDPRIEARLVAVSGCSAPQKRKRDDYRLKGWVGATESTFGSGWDKGHFIAHSIGGAVDQVEVNVFVQRRDLNRGWSVVGSRYREMEKYCEMNQGTFCFSRPIYLDQSAKPAFAEFGVLKDNCELWVECFENR